MEQNENQPAKPAETPKRRGAPSIWTEELGNVIIERLRTGEPLEWITRDLGISTAVVNKWRGTNETFRSDIAQARLDGIDAIAARILATAMGRGPDQGGDSTGEVDRDKLICEIGLKLIAKWDWQRYGDKGSKTEVNLGVQVQVALPEELRMKIIEARRQALLEPGQPPGESRTGP